jgi:hypothetical protein
VTDGLDVVAVGIQNERSVVARVVVALARASAVAIASGDSDPVELVDGRVVAGGEARCTFFVGGRSSRMTANEPFEPVKCLPSGHSPARGKPPNGAIVS